ncbi:uncharacterized protein LOC135953820 [Calliphora vicina]|uniref:uncharacterized protein LOC135953820 n=1 Tax=Calliphora vicina TaxID=7373 RepID=UPI00325BB928
MRWDSTVACISSTLTTAYPLTPSSLSPPLPQYQQHTAKRSLSPVRSYHPKIPPYSCTRLSTRLTPTIYTQAPQQQPTTKSLPNNLNSPTSQSPTCTTTTTAACCKSRICSAHVGSAPSSSSNLQLQTTHHHYHTNKFQSEAFSADTVAVSTTTTTSTVSGSQHTLKALPLPSVNDNNAAASTSTLSFPLGEFGSISSTTISSASSLQPPGGGGCITPTSYKKKSSFMQRKKPILTRSELHVK